MAMTTFVLSPKKSKTMGEILCGETTVNAARGALEVEALEPLPLKGISTPVPRYRLLDAHERASRITQGKTSLVGRNLEMAQLLAGVKQAAEAGAAQAVDILQIPAFLCRQTDLLLAAAGTGRIVNVKKGQFLAPWDMANVVAKITGAGNADVMVTERGVSFGYNTLVSDMRALPILARTTGAPVIFDATHSVQQPGGRGSTSGGEREFVPVLARAAVAVGVAGVFIETHNDPDRAPSDGPNMVPLKDMEALLRRLMVFDRVAKDAK